MDAVILWALNSLVSKQGTHRACRNENPSTPRLDSTDHESNQFFAALPPATARVAVAQAWRFTSVEEE
jgi:hypothetical protein